MSFVLKGVKKTGEDILEWDVRNSINSISLLEAAILVYYPKTHLTNVEICVIFSNSFMDRIV